MGNKNKTSISRRKFVIGAAITSGGILFNIFPSISKYNKLFGKGESGEIQKFEPNIWISIDTDNSVTVTVPRSEMGQGVRTSFAMTAADELDTDWKYVSVIQAVGDRKYGNQTTGGSTSTRYLFDTLRNAAAAARKMFIQAAAREWNVDESKCKTEAGKVLEIGGSRSFTYGELTEKAAELPVPPEGAYNLKSKDNYTIMTEPHSHIDEPDIVSGKAIFGMDVRLPEMKYAVIARPPKLGATVKSYDDTACLNVTDVIGTHQLPNGIAVAANNSWAAIQGRKALKIEWNDGPNADLNSEKISSELHDKIGTLPDLPGNTAKSTTAVYEVPFLAHATMEPMNCTAHYKGDSVEVWAPTQSAQDARNRAAQEAGVNPANATCHVTLLGGGFGRRLNTDFIADAVRVSKAMNMPVKVFMTRDDDMKNDFYRDASVHALKGGIGADGRINGWIHKAIYSGAGASISPPYDIPEPDNSRVNTNLPVPTGAWRSVSYTQVIYANESFIDELAHLAGEDPYEFRIKHTTNSRLKNVLTEVADKAGWNDPLPDRHGKGIACFHGYDGYVAHVVEVSVNEQGKLKVERIVTVVDTGIAINPRNIENQIIGAAIDGLSTAIKAEITLDEGAIVQTNYSNYEWFRMNEIPKNEVHIMPQGDRPSGMGELGFPSVTPALCNAIYEAAGVRVRTLPISKIDLTGVEDKGYNEPLEKIDIYPNPFKRSFTIEGELKNNFSPALELSFANILGTEVHHTKINLNGSGRFSEKIEFPETPAGMYFASINTGKTAFTKRIIKE